MAPMVETIPEAGGKVAEDRQVRVRIGHVSAGRIRLRLAEELGAADLAALADRLALMPGIRRVVVRPATGSVILEGNLSAEALTDAVNASEAVKVVPPAPHVPVGQVAKLANGSHIHLALCAGPDRPDLVTAVGHVVQDTGPWTVVPGPVAVIRLQRRVHIRKRIRYPNFIRSAWQCCVFHSVFLVSLMRCG